MNFKLIVKQLYMAWCYIFHENNAETQKTIGSEVSNGNVANSTFHYCNVHPYEYIVWKNMLLVDMLLGSRQRNVS